MFPLLLNADELDRILRQIKHFIKASVRSANAQGVVVALSGGVDSSVVAALAHDVVDTKALILPEKGVTSAQDVLDATFVAEVYKLPFHTIEISDIVNCLSKSAAPILPVQKPGRLSIAEANLKPRIRMVLNYIASNADHRLVLGTGNRTELLAGYFTKYGDGGVDILPIGNLYKTQVFQLARHLNIPDKIIAKAPSAGLWLGQTDEVELGVPYELLDRVLWELIDNKRTVVETARLLSVEPHRVEEISARVSNAKHKRRTPAVATIR